MNGNEGDTHDPEISNSLPLTENRRRKMIDLDAKSSIEDNLRNENALKDRISVESRATNERDLFNSLESQVPREIGSGPTGELPKNAQDIIDAGFEAPTQFPITVIPIDLSTAPVAIVVTESSEQQQETSQKQQPLTKEETSKAKVIFRAEKDKRGIIWVPELVRYFEEACRGVSETEMDPEGVPNEVLNRMIAIGVEGVEIKHLKYRFRRIRENAKQAQKPVAILKRVKSSPNIIPSIDPRASDVSDNSRVTSSFSTRQDNLHFPSHFVVSGPNQNIETPPSPLHNIRSSSLFSQHQTQQIHDPGNIISRNTPNYGKFDRCEPVIPVQGHIPSSLSSLPSNALKESPDPTSSSSLLGNEFFRKRCHDLRKMLAAKEADPNNRSVSATSKGDSNDNTRVGTRITRNIRNSEHNVARRATYHGLETESSEAVVTRLSRRNSASPKLDLSFVMNNSDHIDHGNEI